ncbi:MAG: chalcone isomerase family protein [Desulfuromonadales bacterium]|nr:chalcone isomerase family protein [Desulfuromonadales bacterium]MBN2793362.1 chalcone isomerase family protein [Desulfuromonadales bacterium]
MRGILIQTVLIAGLLFPAANASAINPEIFDSVGTGSVSYLGMIKVYDATLYAAKTSTAAAVQAAETDYCLALDYAVDLTRDKFILAANRILEKQWPPGELEQIREHIDQLHASYRDVRKGDRYVLCYEAKTQNLSLILNEQTLTKIPSRHFASLYTGIWLNDREPIDEKLQVNLLKALRKRTSP